MEYFSETFGQVQYKLSLDYLGMDLNRGFDSEDEVINPEILALKNLGIKLKL